MKLQRNDPCYCGSGKKYKHCCLNPENPINTDVQRLTAAFDRYTDEKNFDGIINCINDALTMFGTDLNWISKAQLYYSIATGYWDYVQEIAMEPGNIKELINLDIPEEEVTGILKQAGFYGYRLDGAIQWILKTISMIKSL